MYLLHVGDGGWGDKASKIKDTPKSSAFVGREENLDPRILDIMVHVQGMKF